jgi:cytidylate kinase
MLGLRLGWEIVDRQVIVEVASRLGFPQEEVEARDERPSKLLDRLLTALGSASVDVAVPPGVSASTAPQADPAFDAQRAILNLTQEVIRETAHIGNAIIVGHGAAYLLGDGPDVTRVFLRAATQVRQRRVVERYEMTDQLAGKRIKEVDATRAAYIRQVYGHNWYHTANYDLVLDTGTLGYEASVAAIAATILARK